MQDKPTNSGNQGTPHDLQSQIDAIKGELQNNKPRTSLGPTDLNISRRDKTVAPTPPPLEQGGLRIQENDYINEQWVALADEAPEKRKESILMGAVAKFYRTSSPQELKARQDAMENYLNWLVNGNPLDLPPSDSAK